MRKTFGKTGPAEPAATNLEESLLQGKTPVAISIKPPPFVGNITSSELKKRFPRILERVRLGGEILVATIHGKDMAVIVPTGISDLMEFKIVMRIEEARVNIREMLCCAKYLDQSFFIERSGETVAAIVPLKILDIMAEICAETEKTLDTPEKQTAEQAK